MRTIFAEYNPQCNSIDVYTSAGYMLRIDCWEAEKNLKTTPGSECALTSLAIDANNLVGSLSTQCCFIQSIIFSSRPEIFKALLDCYIFHRGNPKLLKRLSAPGFVVHQSKDQLALTTGICWLVGIGDLGNIHYSRVSNAPMNL